jgi:UDP-N-acetylglucosamine 1-carboxyvinyltransferase
VRGSAAPEPALIEVDGVGELYGVHLRCQPDRIEAGTFLVAGLITGGDVTVQDVVVPHLDPIIHKLAEVGAIVEEGENSVRVCANGHLEGVELQTLHYPGFPTDLQSVFTTLLTQCQGTSLVHERVFDNRLAYVKELNKLGAHIRVTGGQTAEIDGPTPLSGGSVSASDLRAGAALIVAGLAAEGTTEINDIYHVDRGYEAVESKLRALGARIERVSAKEAVAASA